ncbi:hypothetical protein P9272_31995 [Mesorhizobium sp. WSM4976]|uniref:hypothetical protein n=1 Tax=Mesorhizobium sp. WSM4976 TaxID=3038549 RepID=UPI002417CF01|nr:hypothetical protein [Mesorhizobium sp. WSM4976]MDG4898164.1 hypothetical protein [Mesorhizobium sp. WSM4976]
MQNERAQILALYDELVSEKLYQFPPKREHLPKEVTSAHGVYIIYGADGQVLHVGKSSRGKRGVFQRLMNHLAGQSSFVNLYFKGDKTQVRACGFRFLSIDDARTRALVEAYATGYLCPAHIGLNETVKISN